jgi:arylsulfatase A-like enzyme
MPDPRPNIVLIFADDLGYGDLGIHGATDIPTPHIDSLAGQGVRFTDAYVTAPLCSPSRAGLLTGRYQNRFGFEFNNGPIDRDLREGLGLPLTERTLAELLKEAGYATGLIGKWHLGADPQFIPEVRGFDFVFGTHGGYHAYVDPNRPGVRTVRGTPYLDLRSPENFVLLNPIWRTGVAVCEDEYLTDAFSREALGFINDHSREPFFLYLPYTAPHTPLQTTARYFERFPDIDDEHRRVYAAMVSALDDGIGRILATLDAHGLTDDTLVIFTNDNGGALPTRASRNAPLLGGKHYLLEGGIRVPMVIRWPGHVPAAAVYRQPVISLDLFTTILAAAGVAPPSDRSIDGIDLVPYVDGSRTADPHEFLFWRFGDQRAVRHRNWKLFTVGDQMFRLHDLDRDIGSRHDLAAEHPELVKALLERHAEWESEMVEPLWITEHYIHVPQVEELLQQSEGR